MLEPRRGQTTVEFALVSIMFLGLLFAVIDLARVGFTQHTLDNGVGDLAHELATINGTNSSGRVYVSGDPSTYAPTPLNSNSMTTTVFMGQTMPIAQAIQKALEHAASVSNRAISTAPLAMTSPMTLTNGPVQVTATPDLTNTAQLTVTVTTQFSPAVGVFLGHKTFTLSASEGDVPFAQMIQ
jgi:Flp pilus assembly protein TadG